MKVTLVIPDSIWEQVDNLLSLLGYSCVTDDEKKKVELLCNSTFSTLNEDCQVIYITSLILRMRGISCDVNTVTYLQDLSDCNNCGLNIPDIIIPPSNTLYMQGGVTRKKGCGCG